MSTAERARAEGDTSSPSMWQVPRFRSVTACYVLARLPINVVALTIVLATLERTGSVGTAGWAEAACISGMAVGSPATGRCVDRFGTLRVLVVSGVLHVCSLLLLSVAAMGGLPGTPAVFLGLAAAVGLTVPPVGPVVRTAWNDMVPAEQLPKVNALESTLGHSFYVIGAGVVSAATWLGQLGWIFLVCAVLNAAGVLLLVSTTKVVQLPQRKDPAPLAAVFRQTGAVRVLVSVFGWAMVLGSLEYTIIGWSAAVDRESLAGVMIGVTAVGAMVASAVIGGRHSTWWSRIPTSAWMLAWAAVLLPFAIAAQNVTALWLIAPLAIIARLPSVGGFVAMIAETTRVATAGLRTETFSWRMTLHLVGSGAGAAAFGAIAESKGPGLSAGLGVVCAVAVAAVLVLAPRLEPVSSAPEPAAPEPAR